ncbi:MAG: HAD family phosphatase [Parachlamydiaceae bacterium]|nr:HAD family phosphatase [Parachlamydiaceae bacterium]
MQWIHNYQLFLFDFDGLLVNTEEIHYLAYKTMCANRGINFNWDFETYCRIAHYKSEGLSQKIYAEFPELYAVEPSWEVLYGEKKKAIIELVSNGAVQLMPGVSSLLSALQKANIPRSVVTHSPVELVSAIRSQHSILNTIPYWITREQYSHPKPNSECYLKAIQLLAKPEDKVIGFEDTPRGLTALLGTKAKAVLVCQIEYPEIPAFIERGVIYIKSLDDLANTQL